MKIRAEAAARRRKEVARGQAVLTPNRDRMLGGMKNRFPRLRLNSVGEEPYSYGENG